MSTAFRCCGRDLEKMFSCTVCSAWGCTQCMLEEPVFGVPQRPDDTRKQLGSILVCQSCCTDRRDGWRAHPTTPACQTCSFVLDGICTDEQCGRVARLRKKRSAADD